jgi:hypothetical protein
MPTGPRDSVSPTLMREVRFVLDDAGDLADNACLMVQPTSKTNRAWNEFVLEIQKVAGEELSKK